MRPGTYIEDGHIYPDIGLGETLEESPLERFLGNFTLLTNAQDGDDGKLDNVWPDIALY